MLAKLVKPATVSRKANYSRDTSSIKEDSSRREARNYRRDAACRKKIVELPTTDGTPTAQNGRTQLIIFCGIS
jgi:hypothetical protein